MSFEFKLQDPGEGIHEAEILEVLVAEGDEVAEGDNVIVAETDKAAVEIPSPVAGSVETIKVAEGDIVKVGDVLMVFDRDGGAASNKADSDVRDRKAQAATQDEETEEGQAEEEAPAEPEEEEAEQAKAGQEADQTPEKHKAGVRKAKKKTEDAGKGDETKDTGRTDEGPIPASPVVRRLARERGVDLAEVEPSGADGRVLEEDVRRAAGEGGETEREDPGARAESGLTDFSRWGETERQPLRSIRRAIAKRMARSWREIPHVTHQDEIDITELETLRRAHANAVEDRGGQLTLTPFFVKALVAALKEHPRFNASLDTEAEEIVVKRFYNIGVALDSQRGLLVPVLRNADAKSVVDIAVELTELAESVRNGRASREQLRGGTFSLTNVGALGGTQFSPIINYPEAAIFGTARAQLRPVVVGDLDHHSFEARLMLPVCVTFDHRINDGADAARFMDTVKAVLSDPGALMLAA